MLIRPASGKKVLWQEMLRHELLSALEQDPVVIVPIGSVEQHGPHCPQDVDISGPYHIAIATADAIDDFPVIVAPPVMRAWRNILERTSRPPRSPRSPISVVAPSTTCACPVAAR